MYSLRDEVQERDREKEGEREREKKIKTNKFIRFENEFHLISFSFSLVILWRDIQFVD